MKPHERLGLRLTVGAVLGTAWSLIPAAFENTDKVACFLAGVPTGMLITWLYTCTSLELPQVYGFLLLPVGNVTFSVLFGLAHCGLAEAGGSESISYAASVNWVAIHLIVFSFTPIVFLPLLFPAIASTCLLSAIFRKRPPRRNDLLPARWDG